VAGRSRIILGFLALFLIFIFLILAVKLINLQNNKNTSQLTLIANENKFKLNFDIANHDQSKFLKVLEKLGLPQSVKEGIEFELDATSAAKLTFATPIKANLNILPEKIIFKGRVNTSFLKVQEAVSIKIPASTNLAIFSDNIQDFIKTRLILSDEFSTWFSKNLISDRGQYFIVFGPNSDFAVIFRNSNIDLDSLKSIRNADSGESLYKEESYDDVKLHLLKLFESLSGKDLTVVLFQEDTWVFFVSSYEAAQDLIQVQKSQIPSINFPVKNTPLVSVVVLFRNNDKNAIGENFADFIFQGSKNFSRSMDQIRELEFILKRSEFSGLINLQ